MERRPRGGILVVDVETDEHDEIPEPPWTAAGREHESRTPLTREAIVEAALRVLERDGAEGLSMRRVAEELGTGAASLYWHVTNKDALIELMVDRVAGEIGVPAPDPARWREQLIEWMTRSREVLKRYPGVGALTMGRIPIGPNTVRWIEWSLALLRGAGIPDRVAAYVGDLGALYLGAYALEDATGVRSPTGEAVSPEQLVEMIRGYFESLPPERFPNIHETLDELFEGDQDDRFRLGLEIIVRGIASYAEEHG
jgi:AcrR family transcriptional regulator